VFFLFSLDYFILVLFASGLVSSVLRQEIGWEERLQNDLFLCRVRRRTLISESLVSVCVDGGADNVSR